ncbi:mRNA export factor [Nematocida displodere]|uniref:mRNA export factor n=1 Tax=Nematocida displodere TaxID=1805483 RepID=A0A177EKR8_9MICR|nr:mRNA export factor [Nematocida displodere]
MYAREPSIPDTIVPQPPTDTVSSLLYSPNSDILAACSWDGSVYIYAPRNPSSHESMSLKTSIPNMNASPILCSCFSNDGALLFTGSADGKIRVIDMTTGNPTEFIGHDSAVSCMAFTSTQLLVTGGWDKKLKFWNPQSMQAPVKEHLLEEKVHAMDAKGSVVVACLTRNLMAIFDAYTLEKKPPAATNTYGSSSFIGSKYGRSSTMGMGYGASSMNKFATKLTWQIRSIACNSTGSFALLGAIDARADIIAIQNTDSHSQSDFYVFKCHKQDKELYPVNKVLIHPVYQTTMATFGGDGMYNLWRRPDRYRLKFGGPGNGQSITTAAFDTTGRYLAYATGYDWSKGYLPQISIPVEIRIVPISEKYHQK